MTYTADKPPLPESIGDLRTRIAGWGADLDPRDRPSVPREQLDPSLSGAHWQFPEQQPERWPRERSIEHKFLTPVFGTTCPPKGLSGAMRKLSYRRYSEGRAAHWLLLMAADRVDTVESTVGSLFSRHPDNVIAETGIMAEFSRGGLSSRLHQKRADVKHQLLDPIIVAAPWVLGCTAAYRGVRAISRAAGRRRMRSRQLPSAARAASRRTAR
jgi:hypothetical protein